MAREYWVETTPSGRKRFVKATTAPGLRRSQSDPHDGSTQSARSRRVDFLDVTRKEYTILLERERALCQENEGLRRKNSALRANWRTCDDELRRVQSRVPTLEDAVRTLDYENRELRKSFEDGRYRGSREREDAMRGLRNKNTKLRNENDTLIARVRSLERDIRQSVGDRARKLADEVLYWRGENHRSSVEVERLRRKVDSVAARNQDLEGVNEHLSRQVRKYKDEVARLDAVMRHHGLALR